MLKPYALCLLLICLNLFFACHDSNSPVSEVSETTEDNEAGTETDSESKIEYDWSACAKWVHDASGETLTTYPDDQFTILDPQMKTGLRLDLSERAWLESSSAFVKKLALDISSLDGWGINAGLVLQFDSAYLSELKDEIAPSPLNQDYDSKQFKALLYMEQPEEAQAPHYPEQVPVDIRFFNEGKGAILEPLRPLKPSTRYGLILPSIPPNDEIQAEARLQTCLAPSSLITELLNDETRPDLAERRRALLELTQYKAEEIAVLTLFTTQSALDTSMAIAKEIRQQDYEWNDDLECEREEAYQHCTRSFNAFYFQDDTGVILDEMPKGEYPIKVHFWRPRNRIDEIPALLFGHGIGGDIGNAYILDEMVDGLPIVRIAIDAVAHGEHPTATASASFQQVLDFFALDISTQTLNGLKARDHFRQSTYDKLQLIELLHQDPDLNQDGRADLRLDKLGYYGLSLGGIMGVELLSLEPRLDLGLLAVPGARLVSVLTDGSVIGDFKAAIYLLVGGKEVFDGLTPLAQALLDAADPGTYAPYLLSEQRSLTSGIEHAKAPHLLMQMSINDEVVPNSANAALARALNLPHLEKIALPIPLLETVSGPLEANFQGESTAALFQFDRVTRGRNQTLYYSNHTNVPNGREGRYQSRVFLSTWIDDDALAPKVIDPFAYFNVPEVRPQDND